MYNKKNRTAFIGVFILLIVAVNGYAQSEKPVYVLVHGAWHGGWCWQKVSSKLRESGANVYTPTLSGLGEHKHQLNAAVGLGTHILDVVNLIKTEDLQNVILVGHSYAGAVIAGVADRIPERIGKLVFLDAILIENGQSALSVQPQQVRSLMEKTAAKNGGLFIPAWPSSTFGVKDSAEARWVNERLTGHPFKTFKDKLVLHHPYGNRLPLIYIACTHDVLPAIVPFAQKTKNSRDWKYFEIATGHDAMITAPDQTALLLQSFSK